MPGCINVVAWYLRGILNSVRAASRLQKESMDRSVDEGLPRPRTRGLLATVLMQRSPLHAHLLYLALTDISWRCLPILYLYVPAVVVLSCRKPFRSDDFWAVIGRNGASQTVALRARVPMGRMMVCATFFLLSPSSQSCISSRSTAESSILPRWT